MRDAGQRTQPVLRLSLLATVLRLFRAGDAFVATKTTPAFSRTDRCAPRATATVSTTAANTLFHGRLNFTSNETVLWQIPEAALDLNSDAMSARVSQAEYTLLGLPKAAAAVFRRSLLNQPEYF